MEKMSKFKSIEEAEVWAEELAGKLESANQRLEQARKALERIIKFPPVRAHHLTTVVETQSIAHKALTALSAEPEAGK